MSIPKLRFPEFLEAKGWEVKELGGLAKFSSGGTPSKDIPEYWGGNIPWISAASMYDIKIKKSELNITEFAVKNGARLAKKGSLLILVRGSMLHKKIPIGITSRELSFNQDVKALELKKDIIDWFLLYSLVSSEKKLLDAVTSTGIGAGKIDTNILKEFPVFTPTLPEQQRIAACLSSLDDLINAQSQQLASLKTHKQGLMQQLFPREGESVPRVRFEGFEGDWEIKPFSNFVKLYRGSSPRPIQEFLTKNDDGINWIKIGDTKFANNFILHKAEEKITKKGAEKSRFVVAGELILANSMSYGKTYELAIDGCIYDGWFVLREYEGFFDKSFLLHLLNSEFMQRQYENLSAGGIVQNISSEIVYRSILLHTSILEQQRIAACLSSLDDLITAQAAYIDTLKQHKKGLMQQLFPSLDDSTT